MQNKQDSVSMLLMKRIGSIAYNVQVFMKWGQQRTAAAIIAEAGRWVKRRTQFYKYSYKLSK